jgi:membrane-associated phospholipid phosphatase
MKDRDSSVHRQSNSENKNLAAAGNGEIRSPHLTRRRFLQQTRNLTVAAAAVSAAAPGVTQLSASPTVSTVLQDGLDDRRARAFEVRQQAALQQSQVDPGPHQNNGDETLYSNRIGSFSKGLRHNARGEVEPGAYQALLEALAGSDPALFESIPMGAGNLVRQRKLVNPQASAAFDLVGRDSHQFLMPPPPDVSSVEAASEAVELYWQAAMRDVPFAQYPYTPFGEAAAADLSKLSDFRGPRYGKRVTPATLFRGFTPGDLAGPYLSQFLLKAAPFGSQFVEQRMRCLRPGLDYMSDFSEWLAAQNGIEPRRANEFEAQRRYIQTGRDLAQWVHVDVLYQAYFNAALILSAPPDAGDTATGGGIGAALNPGNPYHASTTQTGFATFGLPQMMALVAEVSTRALKAVWFQKWQVHRRLRPEAYGGLVHLTRTEVADYPIAKDVLFSSQALGETYRRHGAYLLPQAYPEGSPLHPSYGAGHATVAGACVTVLKAFFDESFVIPNPVVPSLDGQSLVAYRGSDEDSLTVGGELNKLAANISLGRNFAGIHWRSDYTESVKLGEAVAISVLEDHRLTYSEPFDGFRFTKFDGTVYEV